MKDKLMKKLVPFAIGGQFLFNCIIFIYVLENFSFILLFLLLSSVIYYIFSIYVFFYITRL